MRVLVLLAALTATPPPAELYDRNMDRCIAANTLPDRRVAACGAVLAAGMLTRHRHADVYNNRGQARHALGRYDAAIADFSQAIRLTPEFALAYYNRARAQEKAGRPGAAIADYGRAIDRAPDFAFAMLGKAWLLATARDAALRDGRQAVRLVKRAAGLTGFPRYHATLAAAYAEMGRFGDAAKSQELAITRLRARGQVTALPEHRLRLSLYRSGRPFRDE